MGISTYWAQYDSSDLVKNAEDAVRDIREQIGDGKPAQIAFFAAGNYDAARVAAAMREAFPDAVTFGGSTAGEIVDGVLRRKTVVAMAFDADVFGAFDMVLMRRLDENGQRNDPAKQVEEAFARFSEKLGKPMSALEHDEYVGLAIADGIHYYIEPLLDRIGDLTDVPFIGGAAGDDARFVNTPVFLNGEISTDAALLGIAKPNGRFALLKTQGLRLLDRTFIVTGVDEEKRLVTRLDGRPAATVYSEATGDPEEEMDFASTFALWPFGLMVGEEPYLRVGLERLPDSSIRFVNAVKEGMRLKLARMADIVDTTAEAMERMRAQLGSISAVLHFNCVSRHEELEKTGKGEAFGSLFKGFPNAGFSSHGEFFIAVANQTSTMLVFA